MVTGQTRFLLEYCFSKNADNSYAPVMIEMSMTKGVIDSTKEPGDPDYIKMVQLRFSIPLLCIVPISSLSVQKITIDFDMEITSATSKPARTTNQTDNLLTTNRTELNGKIGYSSDRNSGDPDSRKNKSKMSNRLKVSLNAGQLPLPNGLLTIMDLYTKAIHPVAVTDKPKTQDIESVK